MSFCVLTGGLLAGQSCIGGFLVPFLCSFDSPLANTVMVLENTMRWMWGAAGLGCGKLSPCSQDLWKLVLVGDAGERRKCLVLTETLGFWLEAVQENFRMIRFLNLRHINHLNTYLLCHCIYHSLLGLHALTLSVLLLITLEYFGQFIWTWSKITSHEAIKFLHVSWQ